MLLAPAKAHNALGLGISHGKTQTSWRTLYVTEQMHKFWP